MNNQPVVLSVGGSLVVPPEGIDTVFLKSFKKLLEKYIQQGRRFIIVVGGGTTCRLYQNAARKVTKLTRDDLDWLGIHSTRLNGHLMRTVLREIAHPIMIKDPTRPLGKWTEPVLVAAGWKPGWSTDYVATRLAKRLKAKVLVNLSNIDYVCDKDPRKYPEAKQIKQTTWPDFRKIVGDKWDPGMNVPFDPVASKLAEQCGLEVVILNGKKLKNVDNFLSGQKFIGTIIQSVKKGGR
ncbi:MAG: UMP kinase [Candidatus Uhrbacteria bacterium]